MPIKNLLTVIIGACVLAFTASAEEPSPALTLRAAIEEALGANHDVRRVREQVNELRYQIRSVRSRALPKLDLNVSYFRNHDPGLQNSPNFSGFEGDFLPPEIFGPIEFSTYAYRFDLEQPIYTFGRVSHAMNVARQEMNGVREDVRAAERRVSLDVALAYYDLSLARERLRVLGSERMARERQLERVKARLELEDATRLDLLTAQVALANLRPQILAAESGARIAVARLNETLGRPVSAPVELADALLIPENVPSLPELDALMAYADRNRPELRRFALNRRVLKEAQDVTKANLLPEITGNASFGVSTFDRDNLKDLDFRSWSVGVTLRWKLFDGLQTSGDVARLTSQIRQSELQEAAFRASLARELERAAGEWRRGLEAVSAATIAVEQAGEAESLAEDSFKWGAATVLELLEAERNVRQAELSLAEANYVALTALAELKHLVGLRADASIDIRSEETVSASAADRREAR